MIEGMNKRYPNDYHLVYSTPSKYIDALKKHNVSWPTKYDDMMPYSDGPDAYWTGYFSSRANDKGYTRRGSHNIHASGNLYAEKLLDQSISNTLVTEILNAYWQMADVMGINQHHDAITGTGKQRIANDYALRIFNGLNANNKIYNNLLSEKVTKLFGFLSDEEYT